MYAGNTRAADTTEQQRQKPSCNAASRLRGAAHAPVSPLLAAPVRHSCHNNNQRPPASPPCRHHVRRCRRPVPRGDVHSWRPHTRACCAQIRAQGRLVHRPRVIRLTLAWCPCAARRAWPCADTGAARGCPKFRLLRRPARPGAPCLSSAKGTQLRSTLPPPPGARPVSDGGNTARLRPRTPACVGTCVPRRSSFLWCMSSATQLFDAVCVTVWHHPRLRRPVLLRLVSRHHAGGPGERLLCPPGCAQTL